MIRPPFSLAPVFRLSLLGLAGALLAVLASKALELRQLYGPVAPLRLAATDWVRWGDSPDGVQALQVLPPARALAQRTGTVIEAGDRLLAIDYLPVGTVEVAQALISHSPPGAVHLYRLASDQTEARPLFVSVVLRPVWLPVAGAWATGLLLVFYVFAALAVGLLLLILYPFFVHHFRAQLATLGLLVAAELFFGLQALRLVLVLWAPHALDPLSEARWLVAVMLAYGLVGLLLPLGRGGRLVAGLGLVAVVGGWLLALGGSWDLLRWEAAASWGSAGLGCVALAAFAACPAPEERIGKWQAAAAAVLVCLACLALGLAWFEAAYHWVGALGLGLGLLAGVGWSVRQAVLLGKVGEALLRGLVYLLGLGLAALVYVFAYRLSGSLVADPLLHALLPLALFAALLPLVLHLYRTREDRLPGWLFSARRRRRAQLEELLVRIPRFTHSDELIDHVEIRLAELFDLDACTLWLARSRDDYPLPELADEATEQRFWSAFGAERAWWAAAPELDRSQLPAHWSAALLQAGWSLALPLESPRGLLLLGRKRGLLTLETAEQAARVVRQLEVALEILQLLEQEKILLEKTMEASLIALRAQINPHFLFNTFNSIAELIHSSPAGAEAALEKLAWIIRYTLRFSKDNFVDLSDELTLVRTYLELEQIRFADRLTVEIEVEPGLERVPMPAFVLQTVVENCIKHGIARVTHAGVVRLQVGCLGETVEIRVYDNGPGIDPARITQGTGLRNILERLQVLYGREDLIHFENTGSGTAVTLRLPLVRDKVSAKANRKN